LNGLDIIHYLSVNALSIGLATTRVAVIFLILPLFTSELIPPLVRNAIFLALALLSIIVQPSFDLSTLTTTDWLLMFAKEGLLGIKIGVFFGVYLWSFETAGQIIDYQIGASIAQLQDPLTGTQTTLLGLFLARLANYIFVTAGGLMLLSGILLESYYLWPLDKKLPDIAKIGFEMYALEYSYYFQLAILIASPMIIVILVVDVMMGLINRYAQQFNVFFLSLSLKMLAAISMLFLTIVALIELIIRELNQHYKNIHGIIDNLFII
jgi:type III secretion protein T